jgi:hypothetical protein
MIRRVIPGIFVVGLVTGLSGTLAGHLWSRYSQTSELGFSEVYDRYLMRVAKITADVFSDRTVNARVQHASAFEE